jgi:hypothetical protein
MESSKAVVALLLVGSIALYADDKKKNNESNPPPQRPEHTQRAAPPPTVRSEPPARQPTNNPPPNRNQSNTDSGMGRHGGYERNTNPQNPNPNNGRQGGYQPNQPNTNSSPNGTGGTGRQIYQPNSNTNPNPNSGRQGGYQPNQPNPNPNPGGTGATGRQGIYQPNPNPNPNTGRQGGYQPNPNANPGGRQGGYQPNTNPNAGLNPGGSRNPNNNSTGRAFGRTRDGGEVRPLAGGRTEYRGPNNTRAEFHRDGSVREVQTRGMVITHGPVGTRRVVMERPDHTRIVTYGRERGYVQRSYTVSGREYYHRTYYVRGVAYSRVYRPYYYGRVAYYGYVPAVYYRPAFYGWAYSPWPGPVFYRWGWGGSPWYGYYGGYFSPYPSYPSAGLWLTDYLVASNLQDSYQQQMDANVNMGAQVDYGQGGLTPDVKQAIADEVQRQLAQERAESQNPGAYSGAPPFADNNPHVFVVSASLDVMTADGMQCPITQGDVLAMNGAPPPDVMVANVRVMASKGQDCRQGSIVAVSLEDLQEMQNHMREVIDQGLGELQSRQGQGGLPLVPPQARGQVQSPVASAAPPADPSAAAELTQQDQQATQAEQEVVNQAAPEPMPQPGAPDTPIQQTPITISLGQTTDQVIALLGQPKQIVDLGAKKMFVYTDMKIVFMDGKVSDVQ